MKVIQEKIKTYQDKRGITFEPLNHLELADQKNVHIVITLPGFIRGNHFHKKGTEKLIIYGPSLIRIREKDDIRDIIVEKDCIVKFTIPPGISHAIKNIGSGPNLLIAFITTKHHQKNPDIFPDILIK